MTTGPLDPDRPDRPPRTAPPAGPLDMSKDPDRYSNAVQPPSGPLDMSEDPDRYENTADAQPPLGRTGGAAPSLTDLIGRQAAQEEDRDGYVWIFGLLATLAFLGLVALVFSRLSPG